MRKKLALIVIGSVLFLGGFGTSVGLLRHQMYQKREANIPSFESQSYLSQNYEREAEISVLEGMKNIYSEEEESTDWPFRSTASVGWIGMMLMAYGVGLQKDKKSLEKREEKQENQ